MSIEKTPFRHPVKPGYSDSFSGRSVHPPALMTFMEEAAAEHCRAVNRDIFSLLDAGEGWVLTGGGMRVYRYPSYNEDFIVETWISEWKTFSGIREYRLVTPTGEILCEAGGRWVYWDMTRRRPSPIPGVFRDSWYQCPESPYHDIYPGAAALSLPGSPKGFPEESRGTFTVRRGDVDLYSHLHNTIYMNWLMETVPDGLYRDFEPRTLGLRFFAEARLGDDVSFVTRLSGGGRYHEVRRNPDGTLLALGYSEWAERQNRLSA